MAQTFAGFMSYVRLDDQHENGRLTELCSRLSGEVRMQLGEQFPIFQDRNDVAWGQQWQQRIDDAIDATTFLIPIITPSFFRSPACREEVERFLKRENQLGRSDLILPIHYLNCPVLSNETLRIGDSIAQTIAARQHADWRELRFEHLTSPAIAKTLAVLAGQIVRTLEDVRRESWPAGEIAYDQFEARSRLERPNHLVLNNPRIRQNKISEFCEDLVSSPPDETSFVSFYEGVDRASWVSGAGIVQSTSCEFDEVWANPNFFERHEASLYALKKKGLEVQRLFVLTLAAMKDYKDQWHKAIVRHERLGLKPKFIIRDDVDVINREVGIKCDAFGVVNKERMVLVKLNKNISMGGVIVPFISPTMLQTTNKNLCVKASNVLHYYWKNAKLPSHFKSFSGKLPDDLQASLEDELERICFYASCLIDPE